MNVRTILSRLNIQLILAGFVAVTLGGVLLSTGVQAKAAPTYVALGDSVAAGYGAGVVAGSLYASPCERTNAAYPTLAAPILGQTGYNLACTGATTLNGLVASQTRNNVKVPSQISQLYRLKEKPALVTVTIGANDVHWADFLGLCLQPNTGANPGCDTASNTTEFTRQLNLATPQIYSALQAIKLKRPDEAIITGYYDPLGNAAPLFGLSAGEIGWYRGRLTQLNNRLQQLASWTHYTYVDVTSLDATAGDVILGDPQNTYGFSHPTPQGQQKLANLIKAAYSN